MIELKYFGLEDITQLMNWIDNPQLLLQWAGLSFTYPLDQKQLEEYVNKSNHSDSGIMAYKVVDVKTQAVIGHISLGSIDRDHNSARLCRVLIGEKSMLGRGIGKLMVEEALKIAFGHLNLHKVSLAVFDFNHPAYNLYKKIGFKTEGLIREACRIGTDYWSYYEMSILEHEWATARAES